MITVYLDCRQLSSFISSISETDIFIGGYKERYTAYVVDGVAFVPFCERVEIYDRDEFVIAE